MRPAGSCGTAAAAFQRASLVSVELRNQGCVAIRCSTEVLNRMYVRQDAIVTPATTVANFSRARIYKLLRYPSVKDVRCLPRPLHLSLASPRIHIPLGLSWLSFLAAPRLTESPLVSSSGTTSRLAATSPRQQRCANSPSKRQALTPSTGLRHDKLAIKIACPIAVGRLS